jgi:hypothetical protein
MAAGDQESLARAVAITQERTPHALNCPQCGKILTDFVRMVKSTPMPQKKGFIQEWTENLVIGTAAQFAYHALVGIIQATNPPQQKK